MTHTDLVEKTNLIRVLLVDDESDVKPLLEHRLRKVPGKKFKIDWVASYNDGLGAIKKQEHDVYLVDYRLGAQSGLELIREANTFGIQAPFIVLTAAANPIIDLEATKIGAADFLVKDPLDHITLERSIRYAMQHFQTLRALQKSNERFRLLFERSMDAILISDDEGKILEANSAASALFGSSREKLVETQLSDLGTTEFDNAFFQQEEQSVGELSFTQPDGESRFAEFSACRFAPNLNLCILRDITERRQLEREIQEISEREQRRLGQDLHDGLGQALTGINFLTKVLQQKLTAKKVDEAKDAGYISSLINQALQHCRELARGLCPVVLEDNDLHAALQQLSDHVEKIFGVNCPVIFDSSIKIHENPVAVHLYRIAQEATTNAVKHGQAKNIHISLVRNNGEMVLRVKDDGSGLPKEALKHKGMGLRVMQHRARMINASLEIIPAKPCGTLVLCSLDYSGRTKPVKKPESVKGAEPKKRQRKQPALSKA
ncbi:MAG: PAS domain S-box protein [Verrucomicrobia bacterium]|nr:PAS domain S-box protein [Verrucomicrobiota bacterium]